MNASLLEGAYALLLCVTGALLVVLLVRVPLSHVFGATIAYAMWLLVPITIVGSIVGSLTPVRALAPVALPAQVPSISLPWSVVPSQPSSFDATYWIGLCWLIGAGVFALVQWGQQRAFLRRLGPLRRTSDGWMAETDEVGPAVIGAFPPKIVLPADFSRRYTAHEQTLVLTHESMHIVRRDHLANVVVAMVRSLLWFHPLVHLAVRYFRIDQEFACDAAVLDVHIGDRYDYARAMLKGRLDGTALPAGCRWDSHAATYLKRRIIMLQQHPLHRGRRGFGIVVIALSLLVNGGLATFLTAQDRVSKETPSTSASDSSAPDATVFDAQAASKQRGIVKARPIEGDSTTAMKAKRKNFGWATTKLNGDSTTAMKAKRKNFGWVITKLDSDSATPVVPHRARRDSVRTTSKTDSDVRAPRRRHFGNAITDLRADSVSATQRWRAIRYAITASTIDSAAQAPRRQRHYLPLGPTR